MAGGGAEHGDEMERNMLDDADDAPAAFYVVPEPRGDSGCHGEIYRRLWETLYDSPTPLP